MPTRVSSVPVLLLTAVAAWALAGPCQPGAIAAEPAAESRQVGGLDDPAGGVIKGVVAFKPREGAKVAFPLPPKIDVGADKFCVTANDGHDLRAETWVWGEQQDQESAALRNVLVYVSKGLEGRKFDAPKVPAVIDQVGCHYVPHVLAMMTGQELQVVNGDSTLHNVDFQARINPRFNIGQPAKGMVEKRRITRPEMAVLVKCQVHAWMNAYVHVLDHPFYAVTGADGSFTLRGLPPGTYDISVWHEFDRFVPEPATVTLTVTQGQAQEANFTYQVAAKK